MGSHAHIILAIEKEESFKQSGCNLWFEMLEELGKTERLDQSMYGVLVFDSMDVLALRKSLEDRAKSSNETDVMWVDEILDVITHDLVRLGKGYVRYYCM